MNMAWEKEMYKRICEMEHEGKNWEEIAIELNTRESVVIRIYLDGATGALFREPEMYDMVGKVVLQDLEQKGSIRLCERVAMYYGLREATFDAVVYLLERDHGCKRVVRKDGRKKAVFLVKEDE